MSVGRHNTLSRSAAAGRTGPAWEGGRKGGKLEEEEEEEEEGFIDKQRMNVGR